AVRELGHVQSAEIYCAGRIEPRKHCRRTVGNKVAPDLRAASRYSAGAIEHVLVGERDAMKRTDGAALCKRYVGAPGGIQRIFAVESDQAIEPGLRLLAFASVEWPRPHQPSQGRRGPSFAAAAPSMQCTEEVGWL